MTTDTQTTQYGNETTTGEAPGAGAEQFQQMQHQFMQMQEQLQKTQSELSSARSSAQTLEKLKAALGAPVEEEEGPDWFDTVLAQALEAEKAGRPIPLTVRIATELKQSQDANAKMLQELQRLKQGQAALQSPDAHQNAMAYAQLDSLINNKIETIYGSQNPHVHQAVTNALAAELKQLQATQPQVWAQLRSNPQHLETMTNSFMAKVVPPQAMNLLHNHLEMEQPFTANDALEALREAQALAQHHPEKSEQYHKLASLARERYWENKFTEGQRRGR